MWYLPIFRVVSAFKGLKKSASIPNVPLDMTKLDLVLYKFDSCPYCRMVMDFIEQEGLNIPMRDTIYDDGARQELQRIGGKTQVPCLVINGEALYESRDIIRFLQNLKPRA